MIRRSEDTKLKTIGSTLLLLGLCIAATPALHASVSFAGNGGQGTDGNILTFPSGAFTVTASAWSTTGNSGTTFANAALGQWGSYGLGVCNDVEVSGGCSTNPPEHAIGNSPYFDFVLLTFSQPVYSVSLTLSTFGTAQDTDITYFVGSCSPAPVGSVDCSPNGKTLATVSSIAGLTNYGTFNNNTSGTGDRTVNLSTANNSPINWVLVGGSTLAGYSGDYFKLSGMGYTTTPEPATFGLAGAALLGLGMLRKKLARS
jgi:hypothetical protein